MFGSVTFGRLLRRFAPLLLSFAPATFAQVATEIEPTSYAFAAYTHQKWGRERDAPKQIFSVTQGRDGFLWLATGQGLYRFDGVRFERVAVPGGAAHGAPTVVLVTRAGDIWTNFSDSHRFAVYRGGRLELLPPSPATHRVSIMREGPDGSIWALSDAEDEPLLRFKAGRWQVYGRFHGIPTGNPFDMVVSANGVVWLTHAEMILRLDKAHDRFVRFASRNATISRLSIDPAGRIWLSDQLGTHPITGPDGNGRPPRLRVPYATDKPQIRGFTMFDRAGNFWMTTEYRGVQRIAHPDPRGAASQAGARAAIERFTTQNGLTSNITQKAFQDLEGNIWVGTEKGVDRFRAASVVTEPRLDDTHVFGDLLLAARDGSVFIAQAKIIYRVAPGRRPEPILNAGILPSTMCEAPGGGIWITLNNEVVVWRGGRVVGRKPEVPTHITLYDCAFDANGNYWISAARGGLFRLRRNRWERMFGNTGPDFRPRSMVADVTGRVLAQWSYRTLRYASPPNLGELPIPFGIHDPEPVTLYVPPSGVSEAGLYVGGLLGVARLVGGKWQWLGKDRVPGLVNVNGIVVTKDGDHWFAGSEGIVRIGASEANAAFQTPGRRPAVELLNEDSGLGSMPHDHSRHAIVQGGDGRIWIATQAGSAWIDPARLTRNPFPPKLSIRAVRAGQKIYHNPRHIRLEPGQSDIEIDFAVLSLSNPDRTAARYRMEGQDERWTPSGHRREAFYTNLRPGTYVFRVVAANEDGVESADGASVTIKVVPTFVQSIWFFVLLAIAAVLIVWLLLRLRAAQVASQMRARLEQRLLERETIARDLHDTLLQGVQGFAFRVQAVANRLAAGSEERKALEQTLDRADELVSKGRESVRDLRVGDGPIELRRTLLDVVDEALLDDAIDVQIIELGTPETMHPLALKEITAIVGEALFNIGRHAGAKEVELVASYGRRTFRLRVQDNGRGIPHEMLGIGGREGHFGLVGMRERARVIGGRLDVRSPEGGGTEVVLDVPSGVAYDRLVRRHSWLSGVWPRSEN
ncbi:sensor histidine kinase [Novosphingobium chloroacetimidivorans]|uniref:sensor histidine kinase n=1 Tax=Novosphingobium chloroacetimidivorans TaxID=1428314 RepID=UPI001C875BBD|nr:sensor histidine kinase [Novosphingobium chloroacetimidivorans]